HIPTSHDEATGVRIVRVVLDPRVMARTERDEVVERERPALAGFQQMVRSVRSPARSDAGLEGEDAAAVTIEHLLTDRGAVLVLAVPLRRLHRQRLRPLPLRLGARVLEERTAELVRHDGTSSSRSDSAIAAVSASSNVE